MAKNLTQQPLFSGAPPAGTRLYIIIPDGTNPYGFVDRQISFEDLILDLQAQVNTNETNISGNSVDIGKLQAKHSDLYYPGVTGEISFNTGPKALLQNIMFEITAGAITVKVGTTSGGDDISRERSNKTGFYALTINEVFDNQDVFITITNGTTNVKIKKENNIYSP